MIISNNKKHIQIYKYIKKNIKKKIYIYKNWNIK